MKKKKSEASLLQSKCIYAWGRAFMREAQPHPIFARNNYELRIINYELF